MHLRSSVARGLPVVDDGTQEMIAGLDDPLIDPDTGHILGFFVVPIHTSRMLFLPTVNILGWGTRIHVRNADCIVPPEEIVRLQRHFSDDRRVLGQTIRVKGSRRVIGRCSDVQFETRHFILEWLFPRRLLFSRQPIAASEILEISHDAVWVREPLRSTPERVFHLHDAVARQSIGAVETLPASS